MSILKKYELGRVEIAFIVVILVAVVLAGVYVWRLGKDKESSINSFAECVAAGKPVMESYPEQCSANGQTWSNPDQTAPEPPTEDQSESGLTYLNVPEWGIKIKLRDADKLVYQVMSEAGDTGPGLAYDAWLKLQIQPDYLEDDSCEIGVGLFRSAQQTEDQAYKQIGDHFYFVSGGPGACSDTPDTNPDDILKNRILEDFTVGNIEPL